MQKKLVKVLPTILLAGLMTVSMAAPVWAQSKGAEGVSMPKVGDVAPDFKLSYFDGKDLKDVSLSQFRGKKNVVLGFYIFAFTGG